LNDPPKADDYEVKTMLFCKKKLTAFVEEPELAFWVGFFFVSFDLFLEQYIVLN
jgi:hypothetical protein